jgi:hypothetical protein
MMHSIAFVYRTHQIVNDLVALALTSDAGLSGLWGCSIQQTRKEFARTTFLLGPFLWFCDQAGDLKK